MNENRVKIDIDNPSIQRIESKCINCGVCLNTCSEEVGIEKKCRLENGKSCIYCGQCVLNCPMGALREKYDYKRVLDLLKDSNRLLSISIAPAVRVSLGEELGYDLGTSMEDILPSILRRLGFAYVFDVTFGADVTIVEEATELLKRIQNGGVLPMFTSCCPAWIKYAQDVHPELSENISTTKSPIGIMSSLIKSYFREMMDIEEKIISVVVAPCTAKKWEILDDDTDYVITTRELAFMIKEVGIDIASLKPSKMDVLLGHGSKSGLLFGHSGGVMEAALSYAYHTLTGKKAEEGQFRLNIEGPISEASFDLGGKIIDVAVVYGLANLEKILDEKGKYDFIEVMNCAGGCVGGGGQPLGTRQDTALRREKRRECMDRQENIDVYPYDNNSIIELYESFLIAPNSTKAYSLLHNDKGADRYE